MINRVIREGLEGLVLKDVKGTYEPGKRHWLKVKKDYLNEGAMADTADLVVLGAFYGQGSKGGMMSIFLMGCYDPSSQKWCTVTKCAGGHDDATLARLQKELDMVKISKDPSKIPSWLKINKIYYPDFIVPDPKRAAVWEITGAEFSKSEAHTADGISIRFPRCTRIRDDKDWKSATNLPQLKVPAPGPTGIPAWTSGLFTQPVISFPLSRETVGRQRGTPSWQEQLWHLSPTSSQ